MVGKIAFIFQKRSKEQKEIDKIAKKIWERVMPTKYENQFYIKTQIKTNKGWSK